MLLWKLCKLNWEENLLQNRSYWGHWSYLYVVNSTQFSELKIENRISFFFDYQLVRAICKDVYITNNSIRGPWEIILKFGKMFCPAFYAVLFPQNSKCICTSVEPRCSELCWNVCFPQGHLVRCKEDANVAVPTPCDLDHLFQSSVVCQGHFN